MYGQWYLAMQLQPSDARGRDFTLQLTGKGLWMDGLCVDTCQCVCDEEPCKHEVVRIVICEDSCAQIRFLLIHTGLKWHARY